MRKRIIAGNWKCHLTQKEGQELAQAFKGASQNGAIDVVVCPTYTGLSAVGQAIKGSDVALGAQNVYWEAQGAFTGEISIPMLQDVGCTYVVLGHSERRTLFGETDATVNRRLLAVLASSITPIVCVGETLEQREANKTQEVITAQLKGSFASVSAEQIENVVIAYEPVWAIGTGKTASPEQAQEVHQQIRLWLTENYSDSVAQKIRIQYGGSVKPDNAATLLQQADIDGALVGGASLKADSFLGILQAAASNQAVSS